MRRHDARGFVSEAVIGENEAVVEELSDDDDQRTLDAHRGRSFEHGCCIYIWQRLDIIVEPTTIVWKMPC